MDKSKPGRPDAPAVQDPNEPRLAAVDEATLTPLVRQALARDRLEVIDWTYAHIHSGGINSKVYRFAGQARGQDETVPWSLILKIVRLTPDTDELGDMSYWRREPLVYQSGLLDDLPEGLTAPRCFGITDYRREAMWIWLEEIVDDLGPSWPIDRYALVARQLGRLNGQYLSGKPLPSEPFLSAGWLRRWLARCGDGIERLRASLDDPEVAIAFPPDVADGVFRLWAEREQILDALERLPQVFSHLDAFRRNLFASQDGAGKTQTVAIDWAYAGMAGVGEEVSPLVGATLTFFEIEMEQAQALDAAVFDSYVAGLRDAGWRGDPRLARFGYAMAVALRYVIHAPFGILGLLVNEDTVRMGERLFGRPIQAVLSMHADLCRFLLALAEEAREIEVPDEP